MLSYQSLEEFRCTDVEPVKRTHVACIYCCNDYLSLDSHSSFEAQRQSFGLSSALAIKWPNLRKPDVEHVEQEEVVVERHQRPVVAVTVVGRIAEEVWWEMPYLLRVR